MAASCTIFSFCAVKGMSTPKVAIQIITYMNGEDARRDLDALFVSLCAVEYPRDAWRLVLVDNPSSFGNASQYLREVWMPESGKSLPEITMLEQGENTGFAGGHSAGYHASRAWGAEYIYLLNQDAVVDPHFLSHAVAYAVQHPRVALVQSCLVLQSEPMLLNSCGNALQYLGFGFCLGYRCPIAQYATDIPMFYASGAGVLIRAKVLEHIGFFEPEYFMYHEDVDISWRARLTGYTIGYAPESVVAHRYEFSRSIAKFYWMERNRHLTNLVNYHWGTLLMIFPAVVVMELGTLVFSIKSGWGKEKIRSWCYFFHYQTWKEIYQRRARVQALRCVKERDIVSAMCGVIVHQDVNNPLLTRVVNPVLHKYFCFLRRVIFW